MAKFRKIPVIIEAVQLTQRVEVKTLEGVMVGEPGDWLITGTNGEQYPIQGEIFRKTYEPYRGRQCPWWGGGLDHPSDCPCVDGWFPEP